MQVIKSISLQFVFHALMMATVALFVLAMSWLKSAWDYRILGIMMFFWLLVLFDLIVAIGFYQRQKWAYYLASFCLNWEILFPTGNLLYRDSAISMELKDVRQAFGLD